MFKETLYLDIDDTVLDTENYLRKVLGGKWLNYKGILYEQYEKMSSEELTKVFNVLSNYFEIPFISGARSGLELLKTQYNVVFCSSYWSELERQSKEKWAACLGIPIILCKGFTKGDIDMSGSVLVDDNTKNLDRTNASKKICFYKSFHYYRLNGSDVVFSWFELVDMLCPTVRECRSYLKIDSEKNLISY